MVACGGKKNADTPTATTGSDTPPQSTTTPEDNQATEGSVPGESTPDVTEPTIESTPEDPDKTDTSVTTPTEGDEDEGDTDIKVEINNGGSDSAVPTIPSAEDIENSFVIDFDQLLDASGRN